MTSERQVPYYDYALDLILDVESPSDDMLTVRRSPECPVGRIVTERDEAGRMLSLLYLCMLSLVASLLPAEEKIAHRLTRHLHPLSARRRSSTRWWRALRRCSTGSSTPATS